MHYQGHVDAVAFDVIGYEHTEGGKRLVCTFHDTRTQYLDIGLSMSQNDLRSFFLIINYDGVFGFKTICRELQQSMEMKHLREKTIVVDYPDLKTLWNTEDTPFMKFLNNSKESRASSMMVLFCCRGSIRGKIVEDYANTIRLLHTISETVDGRVTFLPHLLEDVSLQIRGITNPIRLTAPKTRERERELDD